MTPEEEIDQLEIEYQQFQEDIERHDDGDDVFEY